MMQSSLFAAMPGNRPASTRIEWTLDRAAKLRRLAALAAWWLASFVALGAVDGAASGHLEASLIALLRLMAAVKLAMSLAAYLAVRWRFSRPMHPALAAGYCVALALLNAAPVLIWKTSHMIAAGVLFHSGLLLLLTLAYCDRDSAPAMLAAARAPRTVPVGSGR